MRGYFKDVYEMCQHPLTDETEYWLFGFCIVVSPIMAPLYYLGKLGSWVMEQ